MGRFIQPDRIVPQPYNPSRWDRYTYVGNNPINSTDSSGHCIDGLTTVPCLVALIVVAGFAGGAANYEYNVSGNSWWQSKEDAIATFDAGMKGATAALLAADVAVKAAVAGNFALEEVKAAYNSATEIGPIPSVGGDPANFTKPSSPTTGLPNPIYDTASDAHVYPRHVDTTQFLNKSKFSLSEGGQPFADEVFNNATRVEYQSDGFVRIYADLQRVVGIQGET